MNRTRNNPAVQRTRAFITASLPPLLVLAVMLGAQARGDERGPAWTMHVIDQGLSGADGVRLFDVDNDGDMDLTVGWEQGGVSRMYLNPGATRDVFGAWQRIDVGNAANVEDAMMADIDADGRIDVVSCTEGGTKRVIVHFAPATGDYSDRASWTTVEFPESLAGDRMWMFAIALDVNEDGHLDIVAGGKLNDGKVAWFEAPATNKRDLSQWKFHEMSDAGWIMSVIPQDMDGDGDPDIVLSDRRVDGGLKGVRWLENPGIGCDQTAPWANHFISDPGDHADFIDLADIDGDGDLDAIVPSKNPDRIDWYERLDASGLNWSTHEIAFPSDMGHSKGVRVGDINMDGQLDIVVSCASAGSPLSGIVWIEYANSPLDSTWIEHEISGPEGTKFDRVELIDLDGDGDLDALTTEENFGPDSFGFGAIWYENPAIDITAAAFRQSSEPPADFDGKTPFSQYSDEPLDTTAYNLALLYEADFSKPQSIVLEKDLFEGGSKDGKRIVLPAEEYDWVLEGKGHVETTADGLEFHTYPEGAEWNAKTKQHMVMWNTRKFPKDFLLEFTMNPIDPNEGLAIVFLSAIGRDGESVFALNKKYRGANFQDYHSGDLDCYHISYWAGRGYANLRKNHGHNRKISGMDNVSRTGPRKPTKIRVLKVGADIKLESGGKTALQWTDPDEDVHGAGYIALRCMGHTQIITYGHFKVWEVTPK